MQIEDIKEIVELVKENELSELSLEDQGLKLSIKCGSAVEPQLVTQQPQPIVPAVPSESEEGSADSDTDSDLLEIISPIVGTFYRASSPDADPFVTASQEVDQESVVCIIEAMKVMNEVKAEVSGKIVKVLVDDATSVQFGQPLFLVDPS